MSTDTDVARCLLGTWPSQVAAWGEDGIVAYISELGARGLDADAALKAIRAYNPDADFPPSAAKLAQVARHDPSVPTGVEIERVLWGPGGVMHARADYPEGGWRGQFARQEADEQARIDAAVAHGPLVTAFVQSVGVRNLMEKDPRDEQWGGANARWLAEKWLECQARAEERGVAAMLERMSGDPLDELRRRRQQSIERSQTA